MLESIVVANTAHFRDLTSYNDDHYEAAILLYPTLLPAWITSILPPNDVEKGPNCLESWPLVTQSGLSLVLSNILLGYFTTTI